MYHDLQKARSQLLPTTRIGMLPGLRYAPTGRLRRWDVKDIYGKSNGTKQGNHNYIPTAVTRW